MATGHRGASPHARLLLEPCWPRDQTLQQPGRVGEEDGVDEQGKCLPGGRVRFVFPSVSFWQQRVATAEEGSTASFSARGLQARHASRETLGGKPTVRPLSTE